MTRRATAQKPKGPVQQMIDREAIEAATAPLVNRFTEQHGDYSRNLRFVVNRGGTAIDRWKNSNRLSEGQQAGILHCQNLWAKLGSQCLVADFDKVCGQTHGDGLSQHEAFAEIARISAAFPHDYWSVFENVCRHDLPAGVAGSRLANTKRSAETAARLIVCFIADLISMRERLSY
jgi:hypothetical protein